jgi:hypothetical protein
MTPEAAIVLAEEAGLDLVRRPPRTRPCVDHGLQEKYEEKKKKAGGKAEGRAKG